MNEMNSNTFLLEKRLYFRKTKTKTKKKTKSKTKSKTKTKTKTYISEYFIIPFILLIFFFISYLLYHYYKDIKIDKFYNNSKIDKYNNMSIDDNAYLEHVFNYINLNINGSLINNIKTFKKIKNPKISIVITVKDAQGCIKSAVRSIQNQDFNDIEIIILDDYSEDESVKIIKELMIEDPRIVLLQNSENKGILYSKTKGVLNAKGKYVMTLDVDDLYAVDYAFSFLYREAEKNNLDIVGYTSMQGEIFDDGFHKKNFHDDIETPIIYQPELSEKSYHKNNNGDIIGVRDILWCYFFRTDLFIKTINEIDKKFLNTKNYECDDIFVFYLLVKRAKSYKHFKRVIYATVHRTNLNNPLNNFFHKRKYEIRKKNNCMGYLSYIEFVLLKSDDNFKDKKIASFAIKKFFLNTECKNKMSIREQAIEVCNLYLKNPFIEDNVKKDINSFLNDVNQGTN